MAEVNGIKLTAYQSEVLKTVEEIGSYKKSCEANIIAILYKEPELLYSTNFSTKDFLDNAWRTYYAIACGLIIDEQKSVLDDLTIAFYLDKHDELKKLYEEYGGYETIDKIKEYAIVENYDGYCVEFQKWNTILKLIKKGFPIKERIPNFKDLSTEQIYNIYETYLNDIFANVGTNIKTYNALDGIRELVDSCNEGKNVGIPLYNANLITQEIGGLQLGHIYGIGANSGVGKSTTAINWVIPTVIESDEKCMFFINEEDETKIRKELLIWVANNIFKFDIQKRVLRDGHFDEETLQKLYKCAEWLEDKKQKKQVMVVPLEQYSVNTVIKLIRKYSSMGIKYFVLDTLKESCDSMTDEIHKSMTRDMVKLYDVVKPKGRNVCLIVTYQLGKASIKMRHYTNNEIGQAKSIVDVMSVNLMMRRPFEDEYEDMNKAITVELPTNKMTRVTNQLKHDKNYMITFICKNRFGSTDEHQVISEYDISRNIYKDIGYSKIIQDW